MQPNTQHSCHSPPIGGDTPKKSPAKRVDFRKVGGKFGGTAPPIGGEIEHLPSKFLVVCPPQSKNVAGESMFAGDGLYLLGIWTKIEFPQQNTLVWWGYQGNFPPNLLGNQQKVGLPPKLLGTKSVSPPNLRRWGGY